MNKTKFFSSLLVAVLFATTSVFVSCKDYDDDIKNLQSQIDKAALKADLDALSTKLAGAESAANAAKTTAENALAKANANATEIAAVKATAEKAAADAADALKKVATAQSTAEAAQAAADGAKTLAENAQKAADAAQSTANAAQTAANAAQTAANAAQATANAAATKQELADAVKKVEDAAKALSDAAATKTELADAKTELKAYTDAAKAAALKTAEAAATAAEKALTDAKGYTNAEVVKINDNIKTLATQAAVEKLSKDLNDEITGLKNTLAAITGEEEMDKLVKVVGSFDTIVETLFRAVTSVELIASYSGTPDDANEAIQFPIGSLINGDNTDWTLNFVYGKQKWTDKFGDKEDRFADADQVIEYTEGKDIRAKQALLVRVNPVNATFTKEDVKLIDSKGRNLDEIITIGEPYRFEGLITRGNTTETGLWVIPVSVVENTKLKDFNLITFNEREYFATEEEAKKFAEENNVSVDFETTPKVPGDAIAYAVAINNTADEADGRFVASTYDLSAEYVYFTPADVLNFNLKAKDSEGMPYYATSGYENNYEAYNYVRVHNRWYQRVYNDEGGVPGIQSKDQTNAYTLLNPEQAWVDKDNLTKEAKDAGYVTPASVAKKSKNDDDKVFDTQNDGSDYRYNASFFTIASVGQKITVSLPAYLKKKAEYWYITYDFKANAVESNPSEWEAWQSYKSEINGIYTMTRGSQDIDLVINASTAQGDVIGFRVFAVNYDGSLLDPDGKAFYVKVGEEPEPKTLEIKAEFMAVNADAGMALAYTNDEDKTYTAAKGFNVSTITAVSGNEFESLQLYENQGYGNVSWYAENEGKVRDNAYVYYSLLKSDKKTLATNWKDVAFIKVGVAGADLNKIKDGAELLVYQIDGTRNDANKKENYRIVIKATKKMPDAAWTTENHYKNKFTWKSDYNPATGELTVYPKAIATNQHTPKFVTVGDADKFFWNKNQNLKDAYAEADWTKVANDAQRMIKDYLSSTTLSETQLANYSFKLKQLPTTLKKSNKDYFADYFAKWKVYVAANKVDTAGATMMTVEPVAIDNSYNAELNYTYKNISLTGKTVDEVWVWNDTYDYPVAIDAFKKVTFKDAMDLMQYNTEYEYLRYYVTADGDVIYNASQIGNSSATMVSKTDNNLYIKWDSDVKSQNKNPGDEITELYRIKRAAYNASTILPPTTFNPATFDIDSRINVPVTDLTEVLVTTTKQSDAARVLMRDAGITDDLLDASFAFTPAWFKFQKNNDGVLSAGDLKFEITGAAATYIKVAEGATLSSFKYTRTGWNNNANPTENISGAIKISGYDAFGHARSFEIPFIIKHNL